MILCYILVFPRHVTFLFFIESFFREFFFSKKMCSRHHVLWHIFTTRYPCVWRKIPGYLVISSPVLLFSPLPHNKRIEKGSVGKKYFQVSPGSWIHFSPKCLCVNKTRDVTHRKMYPCHTTVTGVVVFTCNTRTHEPWYVDLIIRIKPFMLVFWSIPDSW